MEDYIVDRALNRLHQQSLNLINGSISIYRYILNSPKRLFIINKENKLTSVLCDIESNRLGENDDIKKREMEIEYQRKKKSEQKQMMDDDKRSKVLETCEFLVYSLLEFVMDHINNLKVKYLRVLLHYQFGSEKLKGIIKKVELMGDVKNV